MSYPNGQFPDSALRPIPGGRLSIDAANAWNAPGGPADAGLVPNGSEQSYRDLATQEHYWYLYTHGQGNLAAQPGYSNHGFGVAIDCANGWEQSWLAEHGGPFGWKKTEAFSEPWHWNYVGSKHFPEFKNLKKGSLGKRVIKFTKRLAYIGRPTSGNRYLKHWYFTFKQPVVVAVKDFQRDHHLKVDGEIGPKTGAQINAAFHKQYHERHKKGNK